MPELGDDAPSLELPNQHGDLAPLSDFRGEHAVVYSYLRTDTPGCTAEACGSRDSWDEFEDRDAMVLDISDDSVSDLDSFAERYDLPFTLPSDEDDSVSTTYDSHDEKNMFGKVSDGVFRDSYLVGPDGTVERICESVSPDGHADGILVDLDS